MFKKKTPIISIIIAAGGPTGSGDALEAAESKADMEGLLANYGDSFSYLCLYYGAMIEAAQEYRALSLHARSRR